MVVLPKVEAGELTENFQPDRCIRLSLHWLVVKEGWIVCETLINVSIVLRTGSQLNNTCYFFTSHFSPGKLCTIGISRFPIFQPSKYRTWTWFSCKTKTDKTLHNYSKVGKILKGSLDLIPSPSPLSKIQITGGKVCLRCKGKTLLGVVNKLFLEIKSFLTLHKGTSSWSSI